MHELPKDSVVKKSIMKYPDIAAWGAVAPDLGYFQPSQFGGLPHELIGITTTK
ncbi:hypothetical protein [Clostridium collagenovorans]|uniref:hypothetical protein n=1 Tax=Clostridium collagenovorans TaxID=29357 RepID=UPI0015C0791F|nr:hypothetical protein [Clostridium collagenovorans]